MRRSLLAVLLLLTLSGCLIESTSPVTTWNGPHSFVDPDLPGTWRYWGWFRMEANGQAVMKKDEDEKNENVIAIEYVGDNLISLTNLSSRGTPSDGTTALIGDLHYISMKAKWSDETYYKITRYDIVDGALHFYFLSRENEQSFRELAKGAGLVFEEPAPANDVSFRIEDSTENIARFLSLHGEAVFHAVQVAMVFHRVSEPPEGHEISPHPGTR